jgi:hypothetical protein
MNNLNPRRLVSAGVVLLILFSVMLSAYGENKPLFISDEESPIAYHLSNTTDKDGFSRVVTITLHSDGTAEIPQPMISSFRLPQCKYSVVNDELLIYTVDAEEAVAAFFILDNYAIALKSKTVPLYIDEGALYVAAPIEVTQPIDIAVPPPEKAPRLQLIFVEEELSAQHIQTAQLTTSWYVVDENGDGHGYEADSPHPLQLKSYDDITLQQHSSGGTIVFYFTDDYPPQSVSVQRWNAEHTNDESTEVWDSGEKIKADDNGFAITADGQDYVYEVYATWEQGNSRYAFRVDAAGR